MDNKSVTAGVVGRWKYLLGGMLAGLLLLPVPAMALTFSGSWHAIIHRKGKPFPPKPTFTDVTEDRRKDELTVNLKNYQGAKASTSSIELTRHLSISKAHERIKVEDLFSDEFAKAAVKITVAIKDAQGHEVLRTPLSFRKQIKSASFKEIDGDLHKVINLTRGRYLLDVKITYQTTHKFGGWKTISPHKFEFFGF